ncbi:hypothetical protein C8R34_12530 [Nitrosomonas sp. Nm84]|uniref:hypothetical protein n=1 Tax=Nitrosomonas sp. Nm84 TaxID=200124 RepID=UPI000D750FE7|nr:hypothetical protein [Nitrosomonas sp. Nm84]PXW83892.1 hypothetical protein C8R34_12530 [Nitrosomonas sp. Nm84]
MMNSAPRTVNLDSQSLDKVIKALSDVVKDFSLTRRERISYWGLMLSADLAIAHFLITFIWLFGSIFVLNFVDKSIVDPTVTPSDWFKNVLGLLFLLSLLALFLSTLVGVPSLLFSISLICKTFRERAKLELLGITELTKSLWKESRRSRWLSRLRSGFLVFIIAYMIIGAVSVSISVKALTLRPDLASELESALHPLGIIDSGRIAVGVAVWLAIMLFIARYLRNQREQIDLAANAGQLRSVLEKMLQHAGVAGKVEVPAEFIEQAAKIESVQIARTRKTAILKSADIRISGYYAIMFEEGAARQRSMLGIADRIELQDLEAKLSTEDVESFSSLGSLSQGVETILRSLTESGRVEIEFVINRENRIIRVTAVRSSIEDAACTPTGVNGG